MSRVQFQSLQHCYTDKETPEGYHNHPNPNHQVITRAYSYALLHFSNVQLDVRFQLEVFLVRRVDLIFDILFQIGHLSND